MNRTQHSERPGLPKWILSAILVVSVLAAQAQPVLDTMSVPMRHLSTKDGLSQGMINWILQDDAGFMWFATKDGLNRYDGYTFTVYRHDPSDSTTVRNSYINTVLEDRHGRMWVGTSSGLDLFDREREVFLHLPCADSVRPGAIDGCGCTDLQEDPLGNIWVTTNRGLSRITLGPDDPGVEGAVIRSVLTATDWSRATVDRAGMLRGHVKDQFAFHLDTRDPGLRVDTISLDRPWKYRSDGIEFARTDILVVEDTLRDKHYAVNPYGVTRLDPRTERTTTLREFPELRVLVIPYRVAVDGAGMLWLPAQGGGVLRFDPATNALTSITTDANEVRPLLEFVKCSYRDRNGLLWFGTSGYGLLTYDPRVERFHPVSGPSVRYMAPAGAQLLLNETNVFSLYDPVKGRRTATMEDGALQRAGARVLYPGTQALACDQQGRVWMCRGSIGLYDPSTARFERIRIPQPDGSWAPDDASCFPFELINDTLWFGDNAFYWMDTRTRTFGAYPYPIPISSDPYPFLQAIHKDRQGILWLGTLRGLLRLDPRTSTWTHYVHDGKDSTTLSTDVLFTIAADPHEPDDHLWIGTQGGGLERFHKRTGRVTHFTTEQGLPNNVVYGILSDDRGYLWMSTNKGISRFDPIATTFRAFDAGHGLQDDEFNRNAFCKLPDGTLCFGGVNGFNTFRPDELADDSTAHVIRITGIRLINEPVDHRAPGSPLSAPAYLSSSMRIPYAMNMVTFEFATLEYAAPSEHRYQYMLEGFDPDWVMAGRTRTATYTNLDPGTYVFRVRGDNRDGIWDPVGTSFTLEVLPPWWRTWWFYTLCGIVVIGGVLLYIISLERTVRMRSAELEQEKERSDHLLRNILPEEVAQELKDTGAAQAKHFDRTTILFAEVTGWTNASDRNGAQALLDEINACFKAFDELIAVRGIEKIKTIGPIYLCAGGLPDPQATSPADVVHAALDMCDLMDRLRADHAAKGLAGPELRVGINTGPVVAGIVGVKKFQYDIWGDAVNTASRMDESSVAGRVNISGSTYELVRDEPGLLFEHRGKVPVKGKGELDMYFVRRSAHMAMDVPLGSTAESDRPKEPRA